MTDVQTPAPTKNKGRSVDTENPACILDGYAKQSVFGAANGGVTDRTVARYRSEGLPWIQFCGEIYIHLEGGRQWLADRIKRRNPKRKRA
jgi:hypothetical protein